MNDNRPLMTSVRSLSPVWFVPLVALLIAGWLAFRAWQETGPQIVVVFDDAAGVSVGKTLVRYRDVVVGEVTDIRLSDGFDKVSVYIEMDPHVSGLISENTRFWVVAPRITLGGVSGLETLLSGVHIEMDPGDKGKRRSKFAGLDEPPAVRSYEVGTQYILRSEKLGALAIGSPVYHRQIRVGEVTRYKLLPEANQVEIRIFIESPYDELIRINTTFWNVGGIGVELGPGGIEAKMESLVSVIAGGLAFSTPPSPEGTQQLAAAGRQFYLFDSQEAVIEGALSVSYPFLLRFGSSVRGLTVGAPVEFRGIQVGKVEHVGLDYAIDLSRKVDVIIAIQPQRVDPDRKPSMEELTKLFAELVSEGMEARLKPKNVLTGALYVDLVPESGKGHTLAQQGEYIELPTTDSEYAQIARRISDFVAKVQALPVEKIGKNMNDSLASLRRLIGEFNDAHIVNDVDQLVDGLRGSNDSLSSTIKGLERTLKSIDQSVAPDSQLHYRLNEMLEDLSGAAKSVEQLTDELTRYPNSLIVGKNEDKQ